VTPSVLRYASPRMQGSLFKVVEDMNGGKASALIGSYHTRIENIRAK